MYLTRIQLEYAAATTIFGLLLLFLIPSIISSRIAVRDDLRRQDITDLKHALELYNNEFDNYGTPPLSEICTSTDDQTSWLFGNNSPLLKGQHINAIPHDTRERSGRAYVYCATDVTAGNVSGYYLEAQLEAQYTDERMFDEDEKRKFYYRILHDGERVLYRVCGGSELQCQE